MKSPQSKPAQEPPTPELIAQAVVDVSAGMKKLLATRLKTETIVTLVHAHCGLPKTTIRSVMVSLDQLEATYLKPKAAK